MERKILSCSRTLITGVRASRDLSGEAIESSAKVKKLGGNGRHQFSRLKLIFSLERSQFFIPRLVASSVSVIVRFAFAAA